MTQEQYSSYIRNELNTFFPQFSEYERFEKDVYIVEFPSPNKTILLWISTQNTELTIGFDQNEECTWHMHMSQLGANDIHEELIEVINLIKQILNGTEKIAYNDNNKVFLTDDHDEIVSSKKWADF